MARFLIFFFLSLTLTQVSYADDEDWMPQARHYEAASQGGDCIIFRSIAQKTQVSLQAAKDAELHYTELLKVRRSEVMTCAEMRGIELDGSMDSEEMAAESCQVLYQQWVHAGYRLRAVRQDRDGAVKALSVLASNLDRLCSANQAR